MREFDIVIDVKSECEEKKRKIDGSVIHEYSMIVSLADAFHAMLGRSYQNPRIKQEIIKNIRE